MRNTSEKVRKMGAMRFPKSGTSVKNGFWFLGIFEVRMCAKRPLFKVNVNILLHKHSLGSLYPTRPDICTAISMSARITEKLFSKTAVEAYSATVRYIRRAEDLTVTFPKLYEKPLRIATDIDDGDRDDQLPTSDSPKNQKNHQTPKRILTEGPLFRSPKPSFLHLFRNVTHLRRLTNIAGITLCMRDTAFHQSLTFSNI